MIERPKSVAMLRVFEIQIEDGTERRHDTHALTGAQELPPGNYELVLRTDGALAGCKHPREQAATGPTTDQVNHYCPDCRTAWTTWPARGTPEPVGINGLTEAETSATASVMGLPPYPRTEKRA